VKRRSLAGESRSRRATVSCVARWLALALSGPALAACGQSATPAGKPQRAQPSDPTSRVSGDFEMHYNAIRTDTLPLAMARAYQLERSRERVLVTVALLRRTNDGRTASVDGTVTVRARRLTGQAADVDMRRIVEQAAISFIGELPISGIEVVVFEAVPIDSGEKLNAEFRREFSAD
jgi:hypothetical protein